MKELPIPDGISGAPNAIEMIRVWVGNEDIQVSMLLGMWEDALECNINEKTAWGELLADLIRHITNGLNESYGWNKKETQMTIANSLLHHLGHGKDTTEGQYKEDT